MDLCILDHRFKHKNPEDPAEVPGGFITDCNKVRTVTTCTVDMAATDAPWSNGWLVLCPWARHVYSHDHVQI